ncbi:VMAP-C domain-containing protein [Nocardiopsis mwathae]|uniref:VMAP-C domain-containing protein n=1 Tax=Nocardiopsis mwathae TaxID=1472723 RepID=UPI0031B56B26
MAGGGVLVPENRVLTCVHVVNAALRRGSDPAPPEPGVTIPLGAPDPSGYRPVTARVIESTWDADRDTTLLRIEAQDGHEYASAWLAARMADVTETRPRDVRLRGYPTGVPEGLLAEARVVGYGGGIPGRAQLNVVDSVVGVEQGFSGCGVQDTADGSVIGIVTTARFDPRHPHRSRVAFMEPLEHIAALRSHLDDPESEEVRRLLSGLRFEEVRTAYDASTRHRGPEPADFDSAWEAFVRLKRYTPGPDHMPCEIAYLARIDKLGLGDSRTLRRYIESRPPGYVPRDALERIYIEPPPAPAGGTLIIAAEPIPGDPDAVPRYTLSHWLDSGDSITNRGSRHITEDTLRETVLEMVVDAEARLPIWDSPAPVGLRLELVLPFPLITQQIAQWRLPGPLSGEEGGRIGASYEIVLHSAERITDRRLAGARRKLRERLYGLTRASEGRVHRIPPRPRSPEEPPLADQLDHPGITLCVLGAPPRDRDGRLQLYHAVEAGLPAIAWLDADTGETRRFHGHMQSVTRCEGRKISHGELSALPRHVHSWRRVNIISGQSGTEGYDPYDINIILDDMSHIQRLLRIGILSTPQ